MKAFIQVGDSRSPTSGPEWHTGGTAMRGLPEEIRVSCCAACGLRAGQVWEDCPATGFEHDMSVVQTYRPVPS